MYDRQTFPQRRLRGEIIVMQLAVFNFNQAENMLNPHHVRRLRLLVQEKSSFDKLDQFTIERCEIDVTEEYGDAATILSENADLESEMYGPERIFGTPHEVSCLNGVKAQRIGNSDLTLWKLRNARVIGNDTVMYGRHLFSNKPITSGDSFIGFKSANHSNHQGFVYEEDSSSKKGSIFFVCSQKKRSISGTGVFLANLEPGNYGSFLFRVLPQILFLSKHKINFDFYVTAGRNEWLFSALALCGLPIKPIFSLNEIIGDNIENLFAVSGVNQEGWINPLILDTLSNLAKTTAQNENSSAAFGSEKLYVSRQLGGASRPHYRRLINEDDLVKLAIKCGFEIIFPETLRFEDQVKIFGRAKYIVGPSGSGMLNAMFAQKETKVLDLESFTTTVRQHAKIYSSTGKKYSFLFGEIESPTIPLAFSSWSVNISLFEEAIDWLIKGI